MLPLATVVQARYFARARFRIVGVILIVVGILLSPGAYTAYKRAQMGAAPSGDFYQQTALATTSLLAAAALLLFGRFIANWVYPIAAPACPKCSYAVIPDQQRCPECGLALDVPATTAQAARSAPAGA